MRMLDHRHLAIALAAAAILLGSTALLVGQSRERITLLDEAGDVEQRGVWVVVTNVDFERECIAVTTDAGAREIPFARVDGTDLFGILTTAVKALEDAAQTDEQKQRVTKAHLAIARFAIANESLPVMLDRADRHLRAAEKASTACRDEVAAAWLVYHEIAGDVELAAIRELVGASDFEGAKKAIDKLLARHPETAAARDATALAATIARQIEAQAGTANGRDPSQGPNRPDPFAPVEALLALAAKKYREGYVRYAETRSSNCLLPWKDGLNLLEGPDTGAFARLTAISLSRPPGTDLERGKQLTERVNAERLRFYKALIHYYIYTTAFSEADNLLQKALDLRPTDREVLLLQLILDENRIRILGVNPGGSQQPPSNDPGTGNSGTDGDSGSSGSGD